MGYCHLINSQGVKETITLSCFQIDECENIVSITYSLLFVSNSSFGAILSTNEIRHVEFSFREGKMGYFINQAIKENFFVDWKKRNWLFEMSKRKMYIFPYE